MLDTSLVRNWLLEPLSKGSINCRNASGKSLENMKGSEYTYVRVGGHEYLVPVDFHNCQTL